MKAAFCTAATTQSTVPLVTLALQWAQLPSRFRRSSAPQAGQRDAVHTSGYRSRGCGRAHEHPALAVARVLALVCHHTLVVVHGLAAIHQVEMHQQALLLRVQIRVNDVHLTHVEALEQLVPMLCLALRQGLRDLCKQRIVEIRPQRHRIVVADGALDEVEGHLGALQEGLHVEACIARADGIDCSRHFGDCRRRGAGARRQGTTGGRAEQCADDLFRCIAAGTGTRRRRRRTATLAAPLLAAAIEPPDDQHHDDEGDDAATATAAAATVTRKTTAVAAASTPAMAAATGAPKHAGCCAERERRQRDAQQPLLHGGIRPVRCRSCRRIWRPAPMYCRTECSVRPSAAPAACRSCHRTWPRRDCWRGSSRR